MREYLFRGKRMDNGEWHFGKYLFLHIPDCDWTGARRGTAKDVHFIVDQHNTNYAVDPSTVGQYTGLLDENGKKIFEGDVLDFINEYRGQNNKWKCVVEFIDGCFACRFIEKEGHLGNYNHFGSWNVPLVKWWVIGNRWDNPELLEAQHDD